MKYRKWTNKYQQIQVPIYHNKYYKKKVNNYVKEVENYPSRKWFKAVWEAAGMVSTQLSDKFNFRFAGYIPACINTYYRYVIELNCNTDELRDKFYKDNGYAVFRITAFDENAIQTLIPKIITIRETKPVPSNFR